MRVHSLKHWIVDFLIFEMVYSMHQLDFIKCSKSGWHDYHQEYASWQISLCFFSLHSGFTHGSKGFQSFSSSCFWASNCFAKDSTKLSSISDCFGDQKAIKTPKLNTIWLELIARVLNMLIGLKGDNYYSKVFKRVNYKLWNSAFWVVIRLAVIGIEVSELVIAGAEASKESSFSWSSSNVMEVSRACTARTSSL